MNMRDLIPWGRGQQRSPAPSLRGEEGHPFMTLHREMNRLFDDVFSRFDHALPSTFGHMGLSWPSIEVSEGDDRVTVTAEVPGLEEKDVEVLLEDDVLIIRGEKRAENEVKERRFSERFYGRFERRIPLPFEVEETTVEASFANGVLTVTLPKSPKAEARAKRIPLNGKMKDTQH